MSAQSRQPAGGAAASPGRCAAALPEAPMPSGRQPFCLRSAYAASVLPIRMCEGGMPSSLKAAGGPVGLVRPRAAVPFHTGHALPRPCRCHQHGGDVSTTAPI
jgi:hypothetical protein